MPSAMIVEAVWDDLAKVWVATSLDVPGLVTEAVSLDLLLARVRAVVPELLEDNAHLLADQRASSDIELRVTARF